MRVTIAGVHMETGPALQEHAKERLQGLKKHFDHVVDVHVAFVQEPHHHHIHIADVLVHANGLNLRAEGQGIDWYGALDDAAGKLGRQLEKYKGRLEKHKERRKKMERKLAELGQIHFEEASVVEERDAADIPNGLFAEFAPEIVKKEVTKISPMTVDDAVMQMDLLHRNAFLFLNVETGKLNMVHREGENMVRWVGPK